MKRESNFKNDIEIGKIGENDFKNFVENSSKTKKLYDVSEDPIFQLLDIDFIQIIKDGYTLEDAKNVFINHSNDKSFFNAYEVKTDLVSEKTRNVVYELISHDNPGCGAITRAKYFYYVFLNEFTHEIKERWLIDVKKWRNWIRINSEKEIKDIGKFIRIHNFDRTNDHVLNFLCNIEEMEQQQIAKKIFPK